MNSRFYLHFVVRTCAVKNFTYRYKVYLGAEMSFVETVKSHSQGFMEQQILFVKLIRHILYFVLVLKKMIRI